MSVIGIIPARFASTRFPGKPLIDIVGQTMLQRVYLQAKKAKHLDEVLIATDDERIVKHAHEIGAKVVMTSPDHISGTDRCYEAYRNFGKTFSYVLNIQGDEPLLDPAQIDSIAIACKDGVEIMTQMTLCRNNEEIFDTNEVKITLNIKNEALYFSRQPIPFLNKTERASWVAEHNFYRHVGMYAYRVDILEKISMLAPGLLEKAESLEQLRWLENGLKIQCIETNYDSHCVDTPEDIQKIIARLQF